MKLSDLKVGDIIVTKKNHPCGSNQWTILRTGADFKLQCNGCSHTVVLASESVKKSIKSVIAE
ncbi:MAG: DUF951 domain-containing protein [Clostridiales bacterium]|nr:DUF951 domain-containing protein [Clostridiales bacterium]MBD5100623.1 DUF951 domain-containing protein [Clostridiales bacterium]